MDRDLQALFEDSFERFGREHYDPAQDAVHDGAEDGFFRHTWQAVRDRGWFELLKAEDGAAAPVADLLPIFAAAGDSLWREPLATIFGEASTVVEALPPGPLRDALWEGLVSGERPLGFARGQVTLRADRLHGRTLRGVTGEPACSDFVVVGTDDESVFLVPGDDAGLGRRRFRTLDERVSADLAFDDVAATRLDVGADTVRRARARGAILAAAESVGVLRGANRATTAYLRERRQFGRPLIDFQVLQHRLVEMHLRQREAEALVQVAADSFDMGAADLPRTLLALRVQVSRALRHVTGEAIQMHGGMGVTHALRVGRWYKRALVLDSLYGTADDALEALAAA